MRVAARFGARRLWRDLRRALLRLPFARALALRLLPSPSARARRWYRRYAAGCDPAAIAWSGAARFTVVLPIHRPPPAWLAEAIASVRAQTYPRWELICVDDGSADPAIADLLARAVAADPRITALTLDENRGVSHACNLGLTRAAGDYVLCLDHDDRLEPHALARLATAAHESGRDILTADEALTDADLDRVRAVQARGLFCHDYYLSHPFVVHPIAVRTDVARRAGFDESLHISQDIDFTLRALAAANGVCHVPDILYRWRTTPGSAGHRRMDDVMRVGCAIREAHLRRIGFPQATVRPGPSFNTFGVRWHARPEGRVLAIVPTRNRAALLRRCLDTVRATTAGLAVDFVVIDHESDEPDCRALLAALTDTAAARVLPWSGAFNFSAMNNAAARACRDGHDVLLFLNNDVAALAPGWLEAMLDLAMRRDVGAVGATLLYPNGRVQHAGVAVGLMGTAEHLYKTLPFRPDAPGFLCGLHATRSVSAVTGACLLIPAAVFEEVGGFDEDLPVGFNDTDLCLRIGATGRRVLVSAEAVLLHDESVSRGVTRPGDDHHPADTARFRARHAALLAEGDHHLSPLLARDNPTLLLDPRARRTAATRWRSTASVLPLARER